VPPNLDRLDVGCGTGALTEIILQHARPRSVKGMDPSAGFVEPPFLGGQGPAPGYAMSPSEERRSVLRDRVRARLPVASDGSIDLIARAWAVRGQTGNNEQR
jgi:SAM-dependent methyltransferase